MSSAELRWRLRTTAHIARQRVAWQVRAPRWHREAIVTAAAPVLRTDAFHQAARRGAWREVHRLISTRLMSRRALFPIDPMSRTALRSYVLTQWPLAADEARAHAERIANGSYDLLGYARLSFLRNGQLDWHFDPVHGRRANRGFWASVPYLDPALGDHKVIWELNRHQHWLALGRASWLTDDPSCTHTIVDQLQSWLQDNPPLDGVNWASMLELALRAIAWTSALHYLLAETSDSGDERPWLVDLLVGLDRQLTQVERHLSHYFSPNTHLTGEALALYVVGTALPELAGSTRWIETGREVLLRELARQVLPDGGHAERSTHYHRYTLDFYLLALRTAQLSGDALATDRFREGVSRLARFLRAVADESGWIPAVGDDDGGMLWPFAGRDPRDVRDTLATAAVLLDEPDLAPWGLQEETCWIAWGLVQRLRRVDAPLRTDDARGLHIEVFPDTGYATVRDSDGGHLLFDVGDHGYLNGGHAHADALAVTLSDAGTPLLIDPGTGTYTMESRLRDRMRLSTCHNTLTVDGESPSVPAGPFSWKTRADARLWTCGGNDQFVGLEGFHEGYARACHRRLLVHEYRQGWLIVDVIDGEAAGVKALHWHLHPDWTPSQIDGSGVRLAHPAGVSAWVAHDGGEVQLFRGDDQSGLGWWSPRYGNVKPTWTIRVTRHEPSARVLASWIGRSSDPPVVQRVPVDADIHYPVIGVLVQQGEHETTTMLRVNEPAVRASRHCAVGDYQTNGRLLLYRRSSHVLRSLALTDGSYVLAAQDGLLSLVAEGHIHDLHMNLGSEVLEVTASCIPPRLRIQGHAIGRIRAVRLNGRELSAALTREGDTLVISPSDWRAADGRCSGFTRAPSHHGRNSSSCAV